MISSVGISGKWFRARRVIKKPKNRSYSHRRRFLSKHFPHFREIRFRTLELEPQDQDTLVAN